MLKLSCPDHKTFSLHPGLHIGGYKDYICLLTYSINCIFPQRTLVFSYYCYKTWLRQRTLIFTIVRPIKKLTLRATVRGREQKLRGAKVPGNESSRERKFHGTFVPGNESSTLWNFRSRERKFLGTKVAAFRSIAGQAVIWKQLPSRNLCWMVASFRTCCFVR